MEKRKITIQAITVLLLLCGWSCGYAQSSENFAGLKFGVGLSLTIDVGNEDRVESAEVANGIVRITNEDRTLARIMLESHYFFTPNRSLLSGQIEEGNWGMGPFVALQPGSDEIIEAIGLGWMFGFKRDTNKNEEEATSWNIGFGLVVDPNEKTLGNGIKSNRPLPEGEESVRFKENSQLGILILTSFSF